MSEPTTPPGFDPYSEWFGIPPGPRPPRPEVLLGLQPGENNAGAILEAALNRRKRLKEFELSAYSDLAIHLEREVSQAMVLLTSPEAKTTALGDYPSQHEPSLPPTVPPAPPQPASEGVVFAPNAARYFRMALRSCDDLLYTLAGEGNRGWHQSFRILSVGVIATWSAVIGLLLVLLARGH